LKRPFKYFLSVFAGLFCIQYHAYTQAVSLYANTEGNDSLNKFVSILKSELQKCQGVTVNEQGQEKFAGSGIYIANITSGMQKIVPPPNLRSKGAEAFFIIGNDNGVQLFGNSNMAVGHAIFSWLESLGYRYYFANPDWYIVPSKPVIFKKIKTLSEPALQHRRIFYGYGTGSKKADDDFIFWQLANKMGGTLNAAFGHSYDDIMLRNAQVFQQHPEWFYPVATKGVLPSNPKFDMSNEGLVQFIIQDASKRVESSLRDKTQAYKMISLSPSDGSGTCNSPACQQLGSPTDRVYYLVNRVASSLQKKYPDTYVGCLAYIDYIAPPAKKVEPNVYTAITTAFNNSPYTTEQLVRMWSAKGGKVGIYDYFSFYAWDLDIPGQSRASQPSKIAEGIRTFQKLGISGFDGESSIGWVSKGLGYYIAAKLMWDPAADLATIRNEFFDKCFQKAALPIKNMWDEWEHYGFSVVRDGDLARWIDYVTAAENMVADTVIKKRLFQIKSYLHYLFLYRLYKISNSEQDLLELLNYGFRMLDYGSVPGYPAFFELGNRSKIPNMGWGPDAKWRYKKENVSEPELNASIKRDMSLLKVNAPVQAFNVVNSFRNVPSPGSYKTVYSDTSNTDNAFWLNDEWVLQVKTKGTVNYIDFTGDFIADKTNTRPIKIRIYPYTADGDITNIPSVFEFDYNLTKVKQRITLEKLTPGYYTMMIEDPVKVYRLQISSSINYSVVMRPQRQLEVTALNYAFIYVPEGVNRFNVIKSKGVKFITPTGRSIDLANNKSEEVQVDVQHGEAGLWRIKVVYDKMYIEGIPPYIGISPVQMLIPAPTK
jgi:hypothetical protein